MMEILSTPTSGPPRAANPSRPDPGAPPSLPHSGEAGGFLPAFLRALAGGGVKEAPGCLQGEGGALECHPSSRAWEEGAIARLGIGEGKRPATSPRDSREPGTPEAGAAPEAEASPAAPSTGPEKADGAPPPLRNVEGVHPELVRRVERVVDRMWTEHGHRVEVVEGHRTQARQDQLFAQGRTAPGPKVTWTRNSAHTRGEAVDVRIDGGWDDLEAFRRLHVVAREEGIRTLGMKDAGHLELPGRDAGHRGAPPHLHPGGPRDGYPGEGGERRGETTRRGPPRVAHVAPVARVAAVASPGASAGERPGWSPSTGGPLPAPMPPLAGDGGSPFGALPGSGPGARARGEGAEDGSGTDGSGGMGREGSRAPASPSTGLELPQLRGVGPLDALTLRVPSGVGPVPGVGPTSTLLRAEQIRAIQAASVPGGNLQVDLRDVDGLGTDLHLQMRGRGVSADIGSRDPLDARALRLRLGELQTRLTERGLDPERLGVRWIPNEVEGARAPGRGEGHEARNGGGEAGRQQGGSQQGRSQSDPDDAGSDAFLQDMERRGHDQ